MKKIFCCPALELFDCQPIWKTVLFVSSGAFSLSTPTFSLSTSGDNTKATQKKATKCNKLIYLTYKIRKTKCGKNGRQTRSCLDAYLWASLCLFAHPKRPLLLLQLAGSGWEDSELNLECSCFKIVPNFNDGLQHVPQPLILLQSLYFRI